MRSADNPTTAGMAGCSRTKCIRNKRKYTTTDHSLRLPVTSSGNLMVESVGKGDANSLDISSLGIALISSQIADEAVTPAPTGTQFCTPLIFQEHLRLMRWFRTGQFRLSYAMAMRNTGNVESQEAVTYPDSYSMQDIQELQEAHWDENDEAELEGLLLKNLDYLYNEALKRIVSYGYSMEEALSALLKNGRSFGNKDVFSNIVDNAMAYLSNKGLHHLCEGDLCFMDLKQLAKHTVDDTVCVLRQLRSFLSKGDAMWRLLMCDMNVVQASAMEEADMAPFNDRSPLGLPAVALSPTLAASSSSVSMPDANNAAFQSRMGPRSPVTIQAHPGTLLPPGYAINSMQETGNIGPINATDGQVRRAIPSKLTHNNLVVDGSKGLEKNDECGLELIRNIDRLQRLSLDTSIKLECGSSEINGVDASILQQVSSKPAGTKFINALSGTCLSGERLSLKTDGADAVSENHVIDTNMKLDSIMQLAAASTATNQIGGSVMSSNLQNRSSSCSGRFPVRQVLYNAEHYETDITPTVKVPVTEFPLSVADAGVGDNFQELQSNINNDVGSSSDNPMTENFGLRKDEMLTKLLNQVKELETQLQERKDWALQKATQAAWRFGKDMSELKTLRMERDEILWLKKDKQALEDSTMKRLTEMENALRKASAQVDRANAAVHKLEIENAEIRAEMEAAKLSAAESDATCQAVAKREKRSMKRAQAWEKQKSKLLKEITAEKNKLAELNKQLLQAKERQHEAEVGYREEEKAKDEALLLAEAERRAKEQIEASAKRKEDGLRRKVELDFQRYRDDIKRLESELTHLRVAAETSEAPSSGSGEPMTPYEDSDSLQDLRNINARLFRELAELQDSRRDIRRERECVMCMSDEMSVVFLPCAHQVVCAKCNELHEKQGMRECPSCRALIHQRIHVFGVNS